MPDWEHLDQFFEEFAVNAVVAMRSGHTRQFKALFEYPYIDPDAGIYDYDTTAPQLTAPEAEVTGVDRGDYVTIGVKQYDIVAPPEMDGTGLAVLKLSSPV